METLISSINILVKYDDVEELAAHTLDRSMDWLDKTVLIDMENYDLKNT